MPNVFLSHSSKDKPFVRQLADFLRRDGDIQVWLDEAELAPSADLVLEISQALDQADFVLLILSPDSCNSEWVSREWTAAFEQNKVCPVLYLDCRIPTLLLPRKRFDLRANHPAGFREIRTWILTQKPGPPPRVNQLPSRPPLFIGREQQLDELRTRLAHPGAVVHISERPGQGKSTLALEFAYVYQTDFEAVYWLDCRSGNLAAITAELMSLLPTRIEGDVPTILRELKFLCAPKRCLLILDNVESEEPGEMIFGGAASVLITTRRSNLRFLRNRKPLDLPSFTEQQCFDLFRDQLGASHVARYEKECRELFRRFECLPLAINVSAALIREDVRYTIPSLLKNVPADVLALMREAIAALAPEARTLLAAMSACAPEGFHLDLAAELAGLESDASLAALQQAVERHLAEELDREERRYRLHSLVREAAAGREGYARKHAEAVKRRFEDWESDWRLCVQDIPDFDLALEWALANDFPSGRLAYHGFSLTERTGRLAEAFEICQQMAALRAKQEDHANLQAWLGNQALILKDWGRLDEALALLQKQEAIHDLGNQDGLATCYGNQALILQAWGRLDEALALHQKQEAICRDLGNQDGLATCYGNQALILKAWGRLDEAFALHQKEEAICRDLGNQDGLQRTYGNQALILQAWGRLDEALALHQKKEAICRDLGNQHGLSLSYCGQALILKAWGRLDEALALHQKEEAICRDLGNQASLAICYWSWGLLERDRKHPGAARQKLTAALAIFTQLRMPRERDAVQTALTKLDGLPSP